MGGGNQQKSAMARARNAAKAGSEAKSTLKDTNRAAVKCKVCMQTFSATVREPELNQVWCYLRDGCLRCTPQDRVLFVAL